MHKHFIGIYATYIEQYLAYKRQLGFKHKTKETILAIFDRFTIERGETRLGITPDLSKAWMQATVNLSSSYNFQRALLLNKLATFLNEQGIASYVMRIPLRKTDFMPLYLITG